MGYCCCVERQTTMHEDVPGWYDKLLGGAESAAYVRGRMPPASPDTPALRQMRLLLGTRTDCGAHKHPERPHNASAWTKY